MIPTTPNTTGTTLPVVDRTISKSSANTEIV